MSEPKSSTPLSDTPVSPHSRRTTASLRLRRLTITAVFIAMGVATKTVTKISLSAFGAGGMQISFGGIFTFFPAALFGPWYGGIASAMSDLLGHLIAPTGAYIPWLTLTAFLGGFIKGFLWKALTDLTLRRIKIPATVFFVCLGLLGGAFGGSLIHDGVIPTGTLVTQKTDLPSRLETESLSLSPLSRLAVSLAQYNKDTYTLTSLPAEATEIALPAHLTTDTYGTITPTKADLHVPKTVHLLCIPNTYTTVKLSGPAVEEKTLTVLAEEGSAAATAAAKLGLVTRPPTSEEQSRLILSETDSQDRNPSTIPEEDNGTVWQVVSSETWRKYLSGYINFAYAGLLLIAFLGLLFLGINALLEHFRHESRRGIHYLKIAISLILSGSCVTTINTLILRQYLAAWSGRAFLILWIPRICEEWIVALIQAYAIALIYGSVMEGSLRRYVGKLSR